MNYYQHHIGDFVRDTSRLTDDQCMAYLRMIWMYYESEQPLTANVRILALRIGAQEGDIELLLEAFFKKDGDVWKHARCDREIEAYKRMSDGGKQGAAKRWAKGSDKGAIGGLSPAQCTPNANQEPITNNQEPLESKAIRAPRFDAQAHLVSLGVDCQIAEDWIAHRKHLKTQISQTAIKLIANEAAKAQISLTDALSESIARGWKGFKADWVKDKPNGSSYLQAKQESDSITNKALGLDKIAIAIKARQAFSGMLIEGEAA